MGQSVSPAVLAFIFSLGHIPCSLPLVLFLSSILGSFSPVAGSFCVGKCNRVGVTVQIDDDIHTGITKENFKEFFKENVLDVLK